MKQKNEAQNALAEWLRELEAIFAKVKPTETPFPDLTVEPDFRDLKIPSPNPQKVEAAIDAVDDYGIKGELTERAQRLEDNLEAFYAQRRAFVKECQDMKLAEERQSRGKLSNAPEALKAFRRMLKGDIDRLRELVALAERGPLCEAAKPTPVVLVGRQAEMLSAADANSAKAAAYAETTAARRLKDLQGMSAGGRKGVKALKEQLESSRDAARKAVLDDAKRTLKDWDKRYPDRHKAKDRAHSNEAAYRLVADRHRGANGKPIMSSTAIMRALYRGNAESRGKYDRTGKRRGKYNATA